MVTEAAYGELLRRIDITLNAKSHAIKRMALFRLLSCVLAADQADYEDQDDRAHNCNQKAGKVEASDALHAEETRKPAAEKRADDADDDIGEGSHFIVFPHDDAGNPSSKRAKDDPCNEIHFTLLVLCD